MHGNPTFAGWCHCYRCRVDNGSAGLYCVSFDSDKFKHNVTDVMLSNKTVYKYKFGQSTEYYRCATCDTRVFDFTYNSNDTIKNYGTYYSLFDFAKMGDDEVCVKQMPTGWLPNKHIFYTSRLIGLNHDCVDDGSKYYKGYDDTEQVTYNIDSHKTNINNDMHDNNTVHNGSCKCGNISIKVTGQPIMSNYCHCYRCRVDDNAEYRVACIFKKDQFTSNIDNVDKNTYMTKTFGPTNKCIYYRCILCDTRTFHINTANNMCAVYPSLFPIFAKGDSNNQYCYIPNSWQPDAHIFYHYRLGGHDVNDGLKYYTAARNSQQCDYKGDTIKT